MKQKWLAVAVAAAIGIGGISMTAGPASAALTRPAAIVQRHAVTGYHFEGTIHPNGERGQCLTAGNAANHAELYVFGCTAGDALQIWTGIVLKGTVLIALAAHPQYVIGGIPGTNNAVELLDVPKNRDVPLPQTLFMFGGIKHNSVGRMYNQHHEFISTPQRGYQIWWHGLTVRKTWNAGWVFSGPPTGSFWIPLTEQ
jgi:hypothetical protein